MIDKPLIFFCKANENTEIAESQVALSDEDQSRLIRITAPLKKREYLQSRYFLSAILRQFFDLSLESVSKSETGKPNLKNLEIALTMSHSKNLYAFGFAPQGTKIGIDVETKGNEKSIMSIAERHFSKFEVEQLKAAPIDKQMQLFRQLWSLKEAYFKVIGDDHGLSSVLNLSFDLQQYEAQFLKPSALAGLPILHSYFDDICALSVCLMGPQNKEIKCFESSALELTKFSESHKVFKSFKVKE